MRISLLMLMAVLLGARQEPQPPTLPAHTAVRPVAILKSGDEHRAGTAAIARMKKDGPLLLLTALHIFGPSGGLKKQITPGRMDEEVTKVVAESMDGKTAVATFAGARVKKGFPLNAKGDCSGDLAAFALEGKSDLEGVILADAEPKVGDPVWLVGDLADSTEPLQRLWQLRVTAVAPQCLSLGAVAKIHIRAFSGAPIVDAKGRLVGLLIGAEDSEPTAKTRIMAIGVSSIRKRLED